MLENKERTIRLVSLLPHASSKLGIDSPHFEFDIKSLTVSGPPWQAAYEEYARRGQGQYIEADVPVEVPYQRLSPAPSPQDLQFSGEKKCVSKPWSRSAPYGGDAGWHLWDAYSQLDTAREHARKNKKLARPIRIAHIDTGYDKTHHALPPAKQILRDLSRDFTKTPPAQFADDPGGSGIPIDNRGHGTATLCILAGGPVKLLSGKPLGGAPDVEVLPLRVSERVVLLGTAALAQAVHYAVDNNCDIIALSMGGVASKFWVEAFNRAYEKGIFCVAAAGNHLKLGSVPATPDSTVYPALFNRVIAATGVMADGLPYNLPGAMSGNWGPHDKMRTALAAYTPNIPWAEFQCPDDISQDGAGTSSATPQIAAAAALWLQVHGAQYENQKDWRRAEALRQALMLSAKSPGSHYEQLGRGILQAMAALKVNPQDLVIEPPDAIWFPWLKTMTGLGIQPSATPAGTLEQMLHVEFAQMAMLDPGVVPLMRKGANQLSSTEQTKVREYLIEQSLMASPQLKYYLKTGAAATAPPAAPPKKTTTKATPPGSPPPPTAREMSGMRRPWNPPMPKTRRLRVYALDPSYAIQQSTVTLAHTAVEIPWDPALAPGPVDSYLEVVDYDPVSRCLYQPVDLNDKTLLVQEGLSPSPGNPLFHQQMAYAVARKTIDIFESALGRKIFWTGPPLDWEPSTALADPNDQQKKAEAEKRKAEKHNKYRGAANDDVFVPRLRIYPHAMRQQNAYYSQRKGSLLFGYFPSQDEDRFGDEIVFSCLSYDIIAHETTHAILDGMNRTLVYPTNPDVLAFHEAFADIVALLSRFQIREIVANQIAASRGNINSATILGQLGREFGIGTGRFRALRSYLGRYLEEFQRVTRRDPISRYATAEEVAAAATQAEQTPSYSRQTVWQKTVPDPRMLGDTPEPHDRGAILVAAVYGALVSIYETRAAELLRLANPGEGAGCCRENLAPELLELLTERLVRCASQVLEMCIRAIDYLPPTDITFGEYLRAILTADFDIVPEDSHHYRVAFVESFRNWGVKIDGLHSAAEDSLLWQALDPGSFANECAELASLLGDFVREDFQYASSREDSFRITAQWRRRISDWLKEKFADRPGFDRWFGLDLTLKDDKGEPAKFYVRALRRVERTGPQGRVLPQAVLQITQTRDVENDDVKTFVMGGASLIVNTTTPGIDYVILKNVASEGREQSALETKATLSESSLRATYFGDSAGAEPFALIHAQEEE
jgi:subtilisin family serine protease